MMVVAPVSTLDPATAGGARIEIESRPGVEIRDSVGMTASSGVDAFNPLFDVTPAELIDLTVTERELVEPLYGGRIGALVKPNDKA